MVSRKSRRSKLRCRALCRCSARTANQQSSSATWRLLIGRQRHGLPTRKYSLRAAAIPSSLSYCYDLLIPSQLLTSCQRSQWVSRCNYTGPPVRHSKRHGYYKSRDVLASWQVSRVDTRVTAHDAYRERSEQPYSLKYIVSRNTTLMVRYSCLRTSRLSRQTTRCA